MASTRESIIRVYVSGILFKNRWFTRFWPPPRGVSSETVHFLRVSRLGAPPDKPGYKGYFGGGLFSSRDRSGPITRWKLIERLPPSCARPSSRLTNGPKWIGGFEVAVVAMTNRTEQMSIEDAIRVMLAGYEFRYDLPPEVMDAIDAGLIDTGDDRWMWSDNVEKTNHLALTPAGWKMAQQLGLVST